MTNNDNITKSTYACEFVIYNTHLRIVQFLPNYPINIFKMYGLFGWF
jgi:hypothetical protein